MKTCSVCYNHFEHEDPAILTFSENGASKYICPACKELYETATLAKDPDAATAAAKKIKEILVQNRDITVLRLFSDVIPAAEQRADEIRRGTYDFSVDEAEELIEAELSEEYSMTEEDRKYLGIEEDTAKPSLFDRVLNWVWVAIGALAIATLVYFIWRNFF